jgi:hypothetical protein
VGHCGCKVGVARQAVKISNLIVKTLCHRSPPEKSKMHESRPAFRARCERHNLFRMSADASIV